MPSGFSAEAHDCKVYIDNDVAQIRCKCGWERVLDPADLWGVEGEPWREIARAHVAQE